MPFSALNLQPSTINFGDQGEVSHFLRGLAVISRKRQAPFNFF
jgi:hypothetical protein